MPVVECSSECTVTVQLAPAPPTTDNIADIGEVFTLFLVACVVVFCMRELYNLFRGSDAE